jgi:hypothetical protein
VAGGGRSVSTGPISCASPGNCAAGGDYELVPGQTTGVFVAVQRNGQWDRVTSVPGLRALNKKNDADLSSVSCGSPGHCVAAGSYTDGHGHLQAFVTQDSTHPARAARTTLAATRSGGTIKTISVVSEKRRPSILSIFTMLLRGSPQ